MNYLFCAYRDWNIPLFQIIQKRNWNNGTSKIKGKNIHFEGVIE